MAQNGDSVQIVISRIIDIPIISRNGQDNIVLDGQFHLVYEWRPRPSLPPRLVISLGNEYMEVASITIDEYLTTGNVSATDRLILETFKEKELLAQRVSDLESTIAQRELSIQRMRSLHAEELGQLQKALDAKNSSPTSSGPVSVLSPRVIFSGVSLTPSKSTKPVSTAVKVAVAGHFEPDKTQLCMAMSKGAYDPSTPIIKFSFGGHIYNVKLAPMNGTEENPSSRPFYLSSADVILLGVPLHSFTGLNKVLQDWLPSLEDFFGTSNPKPRPVILWATYNKSNESKSPVLTEQLVLDLMKAKPYIRQCHIISDDESGSGLARSLLESCIDVQMREFGYPPNSAFSLPR